MKLKHIIAGLFLLAAFPLYAGQDWQAQPIGPFGTLNNRDNSIAIGADKAQDLLNVDLTPGGKSVRKRKGYALIYALQNATSPVHGIYDFYDASGNEVSLFFNDTKMSAVVGGAASASVLFSTGPLGATYQCTDSLGSAYCVNSSRTTLTKTNGATYSSITTVSSTGTMVATCVTRLAMAGFSDRPSGIDFSADSDFTTWGTGSLGTSAVQLTVNAPGAKITHITYAFGRLMWFKDTSFGYVLIGNQPLQPDWVIRTVSYDVGTNDNSSVYREGILYFRGKDSHIYAFDGSNYQRLTKEISATINVSQNRISNSWTQTTQADFSAGVFTPNVYLDTYTVSGSVLPTFPDPFNLFRNGTGSTKNVWTAFNSGSALGNANVGSGVLNLYNTGTTTSRVAVRTTELLGDFKQGTTYHFEIPSMVSDSGSGRAVSFTLRPDVTTSNPEGGTATMTFFSTTSSKINVANVAITGQSGASSTVGNYSQPSIIDFYFSTTTYQLTINGINALGGTHTATTGPQYAYLAYKDLTGIVSTCTLDNFAIAPTSATYDSAVNNAPNLSTWDTTIANAQNNSGAHQYYLRANTSVFLANSSAIAWNAITNGTIPTIATGTYFQFRDLITQTSTGATPTLNDFTQGWFEGVATDKAYATYFDDRIWWSVASGTGATTNNRTLIYDTLNQGWLLYDLPSNGFLIRGNALYFGSALTGNIYKYGSVENDAGSAINAYWKSKDFFGTDPFVDSELANISVFAKSVASSTMTVTYSINGSTGTPYAMSLGVSNKNFSGKNKNITAGTPAGTYNIQVGNNAADQPFEVFGIQVGTRDKPWIPN